MPGRAAACPPPRAKPRMRERKAKRPESGRGAGENNEHGESRSAAGGERPAIRQLEVGAESTRSAKRVTTRSAATRPHPTHFQADAHRCTAVTQGRL